MESKSLDRYQNERLQIKIFKRRRHRLNILSKNRHSCKRFRQRGQIRKNYSVFLREMENRGYIDENYVRDVVKIPKVFSFKENYDESIIIYKMYLSSFIFGERDLILDFSKCCQVDVANFSFLNVCTRELQTFKDRYNWNMFNKTNKLIRCICSESNGLTNRYLNAFGYCDLDNKYKDGTRFLPLNLICGKGRNSFSENPKSIACRRIVDFVNASGEPFDVSLTSYSRNYLEGFLSEVLNNAEDHSLRNSEWYVNGISFNFKRNNTEVVEVNLAIINIGPSMYEGFEGTKFNNADIYEKLERLFQIHKSQFSILKSFEKEPLFMLYMLNEGISRLKYKDESRGNGTMNFIDSFISLGSFGEKNPDFSSALNVISGHGVLTCDNKYKPFKNGEFRQISLNKENDIRKLPDSDYVSYHNENFPGTILEARVYLNREHILEQITAI